MDAAQAAELQRDLGRLEGTVAGQNERITNVDGRINSLDEKLEQHGKEMMERLDKIIAFQERQKGGARMLMIFSSAAASAFGAIASWVFDTFHHSHN
jgi:chromosome segregation ATPase